MHQCWCSTSTVDSFLFLLLAFVTRILRSYHTPSSFSPKNSQVCSSVLGFVVRFCCSPLYGPYGRFFWIVISTPEYQYFGYISRTNTKTKGRLSVCWCMIIVSKNHTQMRKIERGMANPPLWQWLGWPSSSRLPPHYVPVLIFIRVLVHNSRQYY